MSIQSIIKTVFPLLSLALLLPSCRGSREQSRVDPYLSGLSGSDTSAAQ